MKNIFVNSGLILAGLLLAIITCEALLRLCALCYSAYHHDTRAAQPKPGAAVILCVGDSFTFGVGAPAGKSYPDYLQNLFDLKYGGGKFAVINEGFPGLNSSRLQRKMAALLEKYQPRIVLIMIGSNNNSLTESNIFLFTPGLLSKGEWLAMRADLLMSRLMMYKFAKFLIIGTSNGTGAGETATPIPCKAAAQRLIDNGLLDLKRADTQKAKILFTGAVTADNKCAEAYFQLGQVYFNLGEMSAAFPLLKKAKRLNPSRSCLSELLSKETISLRPLVFDTLLDKLLDYDLRLICNTVKERGAIPVIMTYPYNDSRRNPIREKTAHDLGAIFINQLAIFEKADINEYFSGDNPVPRTSHLNSRGYELFAGTVFANLAKANVIK